MTRRPLETTGSGLRASLERSLPSAKVTGVRVLRLAELDAISRAPPLGDVTVSDDEVNDAWAAVCDAARTRRARANGETVQRDDEIDVDTVLFVRGALAPFGGRALRNASLAAADDIAPGLSKALADVVVGGNGTLPVSYAADHARHPGVRGVLAFSIVSARALAAPIPAAQAARVAVERGLGNTVDEAKRALRSALVTRKADEARLARTLEGVDALAAASIIEGVEDIARAEVRSMAMALEGDLWLRADATPDEIDALVARWLDEPGVLDEARRRAARAIILRALSERHGIVVDATLRKSALAGAAALAGTDALAVAAELRNRSDDQKKLDDLLLPFAVLEWLQRAMDVHS
jgi:FKBP-type peptidyl-prolyl cis-trans isomerase (trigger factor)